MWPGGHHGIGVPSLNACAAQRDNKSAIAMRNKYFLIGSCKPHFLHDLGAQCKLRIIPSEVGAGIENQAVSKA